MFDKLKKLLSQLPEQPNVNIGSGNISSENQTIINGNHVSGNVSSDNINIGDNVIMINGKQISPTHCVTGNGKYINHSMDYLVNDTITSIKTGQTFSLFLDVNIDNTPSLILKCDDNLVSSIHFEVIDNELNIRTSDSFQTQHPISIYLSLPQLSSLILSGASSLSGSFYGQNIDIELSGSSHIKLSGITQSIKLNTSGASQAFLSELETKEANILASGASKTHVWATDCLEGKVSGASSLYFDGLPSQTNIKTSGAASIKNKDKNKISSQEFKHSQMNTNEHDVKDNQSEQTLSQKIKSSL